MAFEYKHENFIFLDKHLQLKTKTNILTNIMYKNAHLSVL